MFAKVSYFVGVWFAILAAKYKTYVYLDYQRKAYRFYCYNSVNASVNIPLLSVAIGEVAFMIYAWVSHSLYVYMCSVHAITFVKTRYVTVI